MSIELLENERLDELHRTCNHSIDFYGAEARHKVSRWEAGAFIFRMMDHCAGLSVSPTPVWVLTHLSRYLMCRQIQAGNAQKKFFRRVHPFQASVTLY